MRDENVLLPTPGRNAGAVRPTLTACPVCGGTRLFYQFSIEGNRLVRCEDCTLLSVNPQPADAELLRFLDDPPPPPERSDVGAAHVSELHQATADDLLDLLERYGVPPGARMLEIGCGNGDYLSRARACGFVVTGIEFSEKTCDATRARFGGEVEILQAGVEDLPGADASYDVCVLSDVIEHVRDPRQLLAQAHRLLKPGGVLFFTVPSLDSLPARLLRNRWMQFRPDHLWYFNADTMETLLNREGFGAVVQRASLQATSFDYFAGHFERYPVGWITPVTGILRRWLPRAVRRHPARTPSSHRVFLARRVERFARPRLSVVMPAYNEAATFAVAFERLLAKRVAGMDIEIIVIESASTDGTREIVARYADHPRVRIIWQDRARGKGHAVRAGLERVRGDYVLIQDADLEYDLEDYEALLQPLVDGRAAFVLGARHGGVAWKMRQFSGQLLLSMVMNLAHLFFRGLINVCFGTRMRDPFTMYKVFRRDCLCGLRFECNRFDFDHELVMKFVRKGYKPLEIPVNYRSRSFAEGKKVSFLRDPLTWLGALVKFRLVKVDPLSEIVRHRQDR